MVTQTIRVNLNQKDLETIIAVQSDTLREIAFEFYATDDEEAVQLDPDEFTVKFNVLKPDNNFVMTTFTDGIIKLSDQMTAVTGTGYYCILLMQDDEVIYSGNGKIIINDHVIGTENIDSVSEADGYVFPDDFYTKDTPLAVLDDTTTGTDSTWSSEKIAEEIASIPGADIIDDDVTSTEKTWSSSKISTEVEAAAASEIDDNTTATGSTWSSEKIAEEISEVTPTITKELTGNPVEFTDGAAAPLVKCVIAIQGYQEGSGTPSPDNVRPIVAYTEGEIEVGGRNLLDISQSESGAINASGQEEPNGLNWRSTNYIPITAGEKYTMYAANYNCRLYFYDSTYNFISPRSQGNPITATAPTNAKYMRWVVYASSSINLSMVTNAKPRIERGETYHAWEPYIEPTTHTTTYPSAIYRGSDDVVGGSVTSEMPVIDLGSLNYSAGTDGYFYSTDILSDSKTYGAFEVCNALCSIAEKSSQSVVSGKSVDGTFAISTGKQLMFYISAYAGKTGAEIKTLLTGQTLAYELATPTTSSVTPTNLPIKSLSGYNHIESSTGEMEIEYLVDDYQPIIDCIPSGPFYSTDEQITGTWTDGRPVYTRIIPVNATWQNIGTTSRQSFVYLQDWAKQIDIITDLFIIGKDTYYGYSFSAAANLDRGYGTIEACWNDPFGGAFTTMPVECVRMSYVKTASVSRTLQRITEISDVRELLDPTLEERREEEYEDEVHDQEMLEPGTYDTDRE